MKVVVAGGTLLAEEVAKQLIRAGYDVTVILNDPARAKELSETLDCRVFRADPKSPKALKELGIEGVDFFMALSGEDKDNLISALLAKSAGVKDVILMLSDPSYEDLAITLGFNHLVIPTKLGALQAVSMVKGFSLANLGALIRGDARFHTAVIPPNLDGKRIADLGLPEGSHPVALYRGDEFIIPRDDVKVRKGDTLVVIVKEGLLRKVQEVLTGKNQKT
ncbi:MAG: TrkA family potassium uptake protein [Desulfurococcales archaeon]|nr:TrkA family potassium uptake protein [Desulfurococcales archaeon]